MDDQTKRDQIREAVVETCLISFSPPEGDKVRGSRTRQVAPEDYQPEEDKEQVVEEEMKNVTEEDKEQVVQEEMKNEPEGDKEQVVEDIKKNEPEEDKKQVVQEEKKNVTDEDKK